MLGTVAEAVAALRGEIEALLSVPADPALGPQVQILPLRSGAGGIGGYLGPAPDAPADRFARHLDAEVVVRVRAATPAALLAAEARTALDLVGADAALLRRRGVLRLARRDEAPATLTAADGIGAPAGRDLRFRVAYEYRPVPAAGEGVMDAIGLDLLPAGTAGRAQAVYRTDADTDPLADFTIVNGTGGGTGGAWAHDAPAAELRQTGTRSGGQDGASGDKQGTYLILRDPVAGGPLGDVLLHADLRLAVPGGIGLVARFRGPQDFAFVLLEGALALAGTRAGGAGTLLAQAPGGPALGTWMRLRLLVEGETLALALDERPVLTARLPGPVLPGSVGIFCRGAASARLRHLRLTRL